MKKTKLLYLGLFLVAFFAVVVVLGSINTPQDTKTAEETQCVASSLAGVTLVNGLGNGIKIPLFPDAKRLSFADTGAAQYVAKAQDAEVLSFYTDRMRSLCWQVKDQKQNEIVYTNNDKTVRITLLTNPIGKTIIDYIVLSPEGVLGTVKIAQQTCESPAVWCPDVVGSGTCMIPPCPAPPATYGSGDGSCTGGQVWCTSSSGSGGWCQMSPCPSSSTTYTPPTCSGTYQQPGSSTPVCNYSLCTNGCTWDSSGCPSGCFTNSAISGPVENSYALCSDGTDNDQDGLIDAADSSCAGFTSNSGTSCPSGYFWCSSANTCIPTSSSCAPVASGGYTSCPSGQYMCNNTCMSSGSYCPPATGGTGTGSCTGGQTWCPGTNGQPGWCQTGTCPVTQTNSCPSGQYMCNGTCINSGSSCSATSYPTDSASCTSQGKYWCVPSGGGSGWCQTSVCPATAQQTTQQQTTQQSQASFCSPGLTWCVYENGCLPSGRPCYPTGPQQTTQTQQQTNTQQQQANTQQPTNCPADQRFCPSSNTCIPMNGRCDSGTTQGYGQGTYGDNKGQGMGPSEEDEKRMQEQRFKDMKRGMDQFAKGVTQMQKYVAKMKTTLSRGGVGIPAELTNALAKAPELLAKLKAAKTADELDELMGDLQDIGMTMQEWGPRLGDLQRLVSMMKSLDKDLKSMRTNFTRVQKAAKKRPELAEPLKEAEALFADMTKRAAEIKVLAKTDPEGALDLVEEFYGNTEEFWNQVSFLDMVSNITRGLAQANTQIRQIETKIRSMSRIKGADKEFIAMLQEQVADIKAALPELRAAMATRPVDYEEVKMLAEDFWMQFQELQNTMADQGQSFYMPTVKSQQGLNVVIPEGFLGSSGGGGQAGIITPGGDPGSP